MVVHDPHTASGVLIPRFPAVSTWTLQNQERSLSLGASPPVSYTSKFSSYLSAGGLPSPRPPFCFSPPRTDPPPPPPPPLDEFPRPPLSSLSSVCIEHKNCQSVKLRGALLK